MLVANGGRVVRLALLTGGALLLCAGLVAETGEAAAAHALAPVEMDNGLSVWVDGSGVSEQFAVRLDLNLEGQTAAPPGARAALVAWLVRAASRHLQAGGFEAACHEAGIEVLVQISRDRAGITLTGSIGALERAIWLLAERLHGPPPSGLDIAPAREVVEALLHEHQRSAVGPFGDPIETTRSHIHGEASSGSAVWSLVSARRMDDGPFLELMRQAGRVPARVVIVVPPHGLSRARSLAQREFARAPTRPTRGKATPGIGTAAGAFASGTWRHPNGRDTRNLLVFGWDLRGAWTGRGVRLVERDVALMALSAWLNHRGNPIRQSAVSEHGLARGLRAEMDDGVLPSLLLEADSRSPNLEDVTTLLSDEMGRVREGVIPEAEVTGAGRVAAQRIRRKLRDPVARAEAISGVLGRGHTRPMAWIDKTLHLLENMKASRIRKVMAMGLVPERRVVASFVPVAPREEDTVVLDDALIRQYVRLLADLRCPADGGDTDIQAVLEGKYQMSPGRYMAISRAMTQRPDVMRRLVGDADATCEEYERLRGILAPLDVVAMHETIACDAWRLKGQRRARRLARIYKRYDIDPSWRRPLVEMAREDLQYGTAIVAIDQRCPKPEEER